MISKKLVVLACWSLQVISSFASKVEAPQYLVNPLRLTSASLLDITIGEVTSLFQDGSLTSAELVKTCLGRIAEVNDVLHSVSEINPDALSIAEALDHERNSGHVRGPLHGVPILLKDNIATADEMNNTAGSVCLIGYHPHRDSTLVSKLRAAGAVILGKATMSEWAYYRSSHSSTNMGWSGYGGQGLGAYCEKQDPFGSSSGSGVSVSIGLALGALGTETSGSIVGPSSQNNVVGIKPTRGLTSRDLVIPITIRQDTIGPMAKTVKDAAIILSAIAGKDPNDNYTSLQPFDEPPDYTKSLNYFALSGARIGIPRNGLSARTKRDTAMMEAFEAAIEIMRIAGAQIIDHANFPAFNDSVEDSISAISKNYSNKVTGSDFIAGIADYLTEVSHPDGKRYHNVEELLECTQTDPREEYPTRDAESWDEALALNCTNGSQEVWDAYQYNLYFGNEGGVVGALDLHNLDALIIPSLSSSYLSGLAGLPIISVPLGVHPAETKIEMDETGLLVQVGPNTPFGIAFLGRAWSEETLIGLAYAFEQRSMMRRKVVPFLAPKRELDLGS